MKRFILSLFSLCAIMACGDNAADLDNSNNGDNQQQATSSFTKGADISWYTEMENDGVKFYNSNGTETSCPTLMKQLGMNAVRLRVWVNPENAACNYCNEQDVVNKAIAAKKEGLDVMVDFHYSDLWADPSRQETPKAWKNLSLDKLCNKVAEHTLSVLNSIKQAGVTPKWIQIGNETRSGMLYPTGSQYVLNDNNLPLTDASGQWKKKADGWSNFAKLYMAGYNAAKQVFADAKVMPHLNHAYDVDGNTWWLDQLKANGGQFDMVGYSHYPQVDDDSKTAAQLNALAINCIKKTNEKYSVPVMVVEFGVKTNDNESEAANVAQSFMNSIKNLTTSVCAGIFYWEPEVYNNWRPVSYTTFFDNWGAYNMGAFTNNGKPSSVLNAWK